jgi:DNA mismatch endonuclease (patch repair protein)
MPDIVDTATRSRMMAGIRGKNTKPELEVRRFLHRLGFRYRLHDRRLPGRPDIVLPKYRTVVFVHGCFWHQHPGCRLSARPDTNATFWRNKLRANVERDERDQTRLKELGWRPLTVWECALGDVVMLPGRIRETPSPADPKDSGKPV